MKEFYKLLIFWLLFVGLYCYKPPLMNVNSTEDVPELQKENLRIENGYAIIEMKAGDDFNEYNASLLLDRNESFIFIFNITYADGIKNYFTLTLNTSTNVNSTMISLMCDTMYRKVIFIYEGDLIGLFDNSDSMAFELLPDGTLTNNGSNVIPKKFTFSGAEIQEEDGKRRIDFSISWKNKVYGEFMVPLNQFAVEAPPTTTTSTTTTSTTTETTTTTTTPKKLVTENTKPSSKKDSSVEKASISGTSDAMIWGIGLFIFAVLYLIVIGVAVYFYRKKKRELRAKARTSYSPLATHPKKNAVNVQTTAKPNSKLPTLPPSGAAQVPSSNVIKSNPPKTAKPPSAPAKQALVTKSTVPVPTKPTPLTKHVEPAPVPIPAATNMKSAEPAKPAQMDKKVEPAPIPTKIPPSQPTQPSTTTGPKAASQPPPPTQNSDEKKMVGKEIGKPGENYVEFARINEKK